MLDVHPPHQAAHTWKDFFIHIATIVIGLLIAVGLEQTVEAAHHAHQRRELREALRRDNEINNAWAQDDIAELDQRRLWAMEQLSRIEEAGPTGSLTLHRQSQKTILVPNTGVWIAAKQNGEVSLLSVGEQNWLTDAYRLEDRLFVEATGSAARTDAAWTELDRQLLRRTTALASGDFDLSGMTPAQRLQLDDCLRTLIENVREFESGVLIYGSYIEYLHTTPDDQLEESNSPERAESLFRRNLDAHSDLQSILGPQH